ncbi:MAG: isochorismatase family cysteine hydrolase [Acidobacteriota bacterium]
MELIGAVLVVVDMQTGFLNDNSKSIIPAVVALIDKCARRGIPSVFTKFINQPESPYEILMGWQRVRDSPETDLHTAFFSRAEIVLEKHFYTAFTSEFDDLVRKNDWRSILISGVSTESCVLKTAVDAFERGLRPVVIGEACASDIGPDVHRMGLEILEVLIGKDQITSADRLFLPTDPDN